MIRPSLRTLVLSIGILLLNAGCESKPVSVDLGEHGYQVASFTAVADSSRTIKDHTGHGQSSRLYLGSLDSTRNSSILIRFNKDVLNAHPDICELPSDSIHYKQVFVHLKSISHFSNLSGEVVDNPNSSGHNEDLPDAPDLNNVRAFWMDMSQFGIDWDESSVFTFLADNVVLLGDTEVDLSQLESNPDATELRIRYVNSGIEVLLNPVDDSPVDPGFMEDLCSASTNSDYAILLQYDTPGDLIEFYSSNYSTLSAQPYIKFKYEKYLASSTPVNKYTIQEIIPHAFDPNGYFKAIDTTQDNWGSIIAMDFDPADPHWYDDLPPDSLVPQIGFTDSTFELLSFQIKPITHNADSSGTIIFYLSDIILGSMDLDPSDDNYPDYETGTENNHNFDLGELFFDCGTDGICNEDETGYQPDGTEDNLIWDEGELYSDTGVDSLESINEPGYDAITNPDPNGDDFRDDPSMDDWHDCGADGLCPGDPGYTGPDEGESDGTYNQGEGTESNGHFDVNELFWDYGLDGISDVNEPGYDETVNPDPSGDNWSASNPSGTEGNGIFDWTDLNNNSIQDEDDLFEVFMDAGADSLWSYSEEGYNPYGKEGNGIYDLGEPFEDCGINQICDGEPSGDPDGDDYRPDPAGDDFNSADSTGTESNGVLDWTDGNNNNGLWDPGEGEEWFDWGIDKTENESEPYYGGRRLMLNQSPVFFTWNYPNETEAHFDDLTIDADNGEEAAIWISSITPVSGTEFFNITVSMKTLVPLHGFQMRLNHVPLMLDEINFGEINTSVWQIDNEKIIDDISLYNTDIYPESILESQNLISYGLNLKTYFDFYGLQDFLAENPEAIISKALLHFWIDSTHSDIHGNMVITLDRLTDYISLPADSLPIVPVKSINLTDISGSGEITLDIKSHIQNLSYGVYADYGFILEGNHNSYNFSLLTLNNQSLSDSLKPKLEILYSK